MRFKAFMITRIDILCVSFWYSEIYIDDWGNSFEMLEITRHTNRCLTPEDHIMNMKLWNQTQEAEIECLTVGRPGP